MSQATRTQARHIRRLAYLAAGRAASSFAAFLNRDIRALEPRLCAASGTATAGRGETGVIFEVEGEVHGLMALLLPVGGRDWLTELLCPGRDPTDELAISALQETGNIIASHAVSAMADHLGATVTLSIPLLVVTLGLFYFVLNGLLLWVASWILPGYSVSGVAAGVVGSLVIALVNWACGVLFRRRAW